MVGIWLIYEAVVSIFAESRDSILVGYFNKGLFRLKITNSAKDVVVKELTGEGVVDIITDSFDRYFYTTPSYRLCYTTDFVAIEKLGSFKNMSDSKANHLKINIDKTMIAFRKDNFRIAIYSIDDKKPALRKLIKTDHTWGIITDFIFAWEGVLILTKSGMMVYDPFKSSREIVKHKCKPAEGFKDMEYNCFDYLPQKNLIVMASSFYDKELKITHSWIEILGLFAGGIYLKDQVELDKCKGIFYLLNTIDGDKDSYIGKVSGQFCSNGDNLLFIARYGKPYTLFVYIYHNGLIRPYATPQVLHKGSSVSNHNS